MWLLSIILLFCNLLALISTFVKLNDPQDVLSESCRISKEEEDMCEGSDEDDHSKEPCFHEDFTPTKKTD